MFCEFSTIPASACGVDLCILCKQPRWLLQKLGNLSANKAYSTLCGLTWGGATNIQLSEVCRLEMAWVHWVPKFFFYRQTTEDINAWWLLENTWKYVVSQCFSMFLMAQPQPHWTLRDTPNILSSNPFCVRCPPLPTDAFLRRNGRWLLRAAAGWGQCDSPHGEGRQGQWPRHSRCHGKSPAVAVRWWGASGLETTLGRKPSWPQHLGSLNIPFLDQNGSWACHILVLLGVAVGYYIVPAWSFKWRSTFLGPRSRAQPRSPQRVSPNA